MHAVKLNEAQADSVECRHVEQAREVAYDKFFCPECVKLGDSWVHLRICMLCGRVGSAA